MPLTVCAMTPSMLALCVALLPQMARSDAPVERDLVDWLSAQPVDGAAVIRLHRYHRKIDIARRVMTAYDDEITVATSEQVISPAGYLALALAFAVAASREAGEVQVVRAHRARWLNSAFNCLAQLTAVDPVLTGQREALVPAVLGLLAQVLDA